MCILLLHFIQRRPHMASSTADQLSSLGGGGTENDTSTSPTDDASLTRRYRRGSNDDTDGSSPLSQQLHQPGVGASKKRKIGPGSRGVANLTPEQLEKKRANGECASVCFLPIGSVHNLG